MRRITALDPGGTTGCATYGDDGFAATQGPPDEILDYLHDALQEQFDGDGVSGCPDLVVCESFVITPETMRKSRGGSNAAIEAIGVARWLCRRAEVGFRLQSPGEAKGFAGNDKLRRMGWYDGVPEHARDAARHLLLACVREGLIDAAKVLPEEGTMVLDQGGGA